MVFPALVLTGLSALQVVEACCSCSSQPPVQAAALQAVRGALQRSQVGANGGVPSAEAAAGHVRRAAWAWECASRALPAAAADVHALICAGKAAALGPAEVQVSPVHPCAFLTWSFTAVF